MQKKYRKYATFALALVAVVVGIYVVDAVFFNQALAASSGGVFDKGQDKGNEIAEAMKGKIAVTITGLTIGVVGIMMQMGRISHLVGARIIAGALIVGSCMGIAEFLYA